MSETKRTEIREGGETSKAGMPTCPKCGSNKQVELSEYPKYGSHYCPGGSCGWFTPKAKDEISQEAARDLLKALKFATEKCSMYGPADRAREMARNAIAKAEGR